jgi:hypothetical protein
MAGGNMSSDKQTAKFENPKSPYGSIMIYSLATLLFASICVVMQSATASSLLDDQGIPLRAKRSPDSSNLASCESKAQALRLKGDLQKLKGSCYDDIFGSATANSVSHDESLGITAVGQKQALYVKFPDGDVHVIAGTSTHLKKVRALAINGKTRELVVLDGGAGRVYTFDTSSSGSLSPTRILAAPGLTGASDIALDTEHNEIYVADWKNSKIVVYSLLAHAYSPRPENSQAVIREITSPDLSKPTSLSVDPVTRKVYVLSAKENLLQVFDGTASGETHALQSVRGSGTRLNSPLTVEFSTHQIRIQVMNGDGEVLSYKADADGNQAPVKD